MQIDGQATAIEGRNHGGRGDIGKVVVEGEMVNYSVSFVVRVDFVGQLATE